MHTCDLQSRNPFWKVCEMCVRAARFWACDVRSHFCTLFGTKRTRNGIFFCLKNCSRTSFSVLEHPFLLWNILFCFQTFFSALKCSFFLEHLIKCWKFAENLLKKMLIYKRCGCRCEVRPPQIEGAHMCACAPKSGCARYMRATQKRVTTHTLILCTGKVIFL